MSTITNNSNKFYSNQNIRFVFIDGNANDTIDKCYNTLTQQLSIPDYFGNNLDALEEVMHDLEWIEEEQIKIVIFNAEKLLANDLAFRKDFIEIIEGTELDNLEVVYVG